MALAEHLARARRLSRSDWLDLLQAQVALLGAQALVWTRRQGRLVRGTEPALPPGERATAGSEADALRADRAIRRAARYGIFRPRCLVRAIALCQLLDARGIQASFRVGVRTHAGRLLAHAWVEHGRLVLDDAPAHVGHFRALHDLALQPEEHPRWR